MSISTITIAILTHPYQFVLIAVGLVHVGMAIAASLHRRRRRRPLKEDPMEMNGWMRGTIFALAIAAVLVPARALAEEPKALNVVAVKLKGDEATYLKKVKALTAAARKLDGGGTFRVWRAAVAGPATGTIYVSVEYANMEAFAKSLAKTRGDEEWKSLMKDLDTSGIREVVGNSLLVEITP